MWRLPSPGKALAIFQLGILLSQEFLRGQRQRLVWKRALHFQRRAGDPKGRIGCPPFTYSPSWSGMA